MIAPDKIQRILELLAQDVSIRQIAKQLCVGRNQIAQIARGSRPNYHKIQRLREERRAEERTTKRQRPVRCRSCGEKVYLPCVRCKTLTEAKEIPNARDAAPFEPLGLALTPAHRKRYRQVATRKQRRAVRALVIAQRRQSLRAKSVQDAAPPQAQNSKLDE